jgi:hypothetical protein
MKSSYLNANDKLTAELCEKKIAANKALARRKADHFTSSMHLGQPNKGETKEIVAEERIVFCIVRYG